MYLDLEILCVILVRDELIQFKKILMTANCTALSFIKEKLLKLYLTNYHKIFVSSSSSFVEENCMTNYNII